MTDSVPQSPARPGRLTAQFARAGDQLALSCRTGQWGAGVFLVFWLIGWTVGCVFLAGHVLQDPTLFSILFATPFWASWIFVFAKVIKNFFQRDLFMLGPEGAVFVRRALIRIQQRSVPRSEIQGFESYSRTINTESGAQTYGIAMRTVGKDLRFAEGLPDQERVWLESRLNKHLGQLNQSDKGESRPSAVPSDVAQEPLPVTASSYEPPSDCRWQRVDDFDSVAFSRRGHWLWTTVLGLLFFNLFWNGIVSVFVCELFDGKVAGAGAFMWWGQFAFMIPFEAIGLMMLGALALAILEPIHVTSWRFHPTSIVRSARWLGIGRTWEYPVDRLDRLEVDVDQKKTNFEKTMAGASEADEKTAWLRMIDHQNTELCAIKDLTDGEAHWIASIVLRERAGWFPREMKPL